MKHRIFISVSLLLLISAGCEFYAQDDYEEYYVVESYLIANRSLPQVRVTHTLPVEEEYTLEQAAVGNASVEIRLLDENEDIQAVHLYTHRSNGVYQPVEQATVQPERLYELHVTVPGYSEEITSRTFVPGAFQVIDEETVADSIVYQSEEQINITTTLSDYPGRQSFFIFTVNVVSPAMDRLTPFYRDQVDDEEDLPDYHTNSSGIINEQNYDINSDSTLTLRVPWLAVAFYGNNFITANAIDDNMYDFVRSQSVQTGGSTLPPGEIQNIKYNVEGGIGVFGSMASDTVRVFIQRE